MLRQTTRTVQLRTEAATAVVFACAASAGIHAGIVPAHLRDEPRLGVAFIAAVLALLTTAATMSVRPSARPVAGAAVLVLGGLIAGYIATRTTGIPFLAPEPEAVDAVGAIAVCTELVGLLCALWLAQPIRRPHRRPVLEEETR